MNEIEINGVKVKYFSKVNLEILFNDRNQVVSNTDYSNFYCEFVIYCIHNNINGKAYIGQAKDLFERFGDNYLSHYTAYIGSLDKKANQILYRALAKYKANNFTVYVIDAVDTSDQLNEKEEYWIRTLHTCIYDNECHGYNMTWGGQDCSNLHIPEVVARARESSKKTMIERYGMNHGEYMSQFFDKSWETRARLHDGDPMAQLNTEEAIKKRYENNRKNHGGSLSWNTPEVYEAKAKNWNGDPCGMMRTPEALHNRSITLWFKSTNLYLSKLKLEIIDINFDIYWNWSDGYIGNANKYFKFAIDNLDELKSDERWTLELSKLWSEYKLNKDKYKL